MAYQKTLLTMWVILNFNQRSFGLGLCSVLWCDIDDSWLCAIFGFCFIFKLYRKHCKYFSEPWMYVLDCNGWGDACECLQLAFTCCACRLWHAFSFFCVMRFRFLLLYKRYLFSLLIYSHVFSTFHYFPFVRFY